MGESGAELESGAVSGMAHEQSGRLARGCNVQNVSKLKIFQEYFYFLDFKFRFLFFFSPCIWPSCFHKITDCNMYWVCKSKIIFVFLFLRIFLVFIFLNFVFFFLPAFYPHVFIFSFYLIFLYFFNYPNSLFMFFHYILVLLKIHSY